MYSLLLVIIYIAFISLGLPDSLVGSAWPVMHQDLGVPLSFAGIITMIIAGGTIVSSLMSAFLTRKLGTGLVTAISVFLTAVALLGFSFANKFWMLCLLAVPYGLGAGAVDAALNNYVALHYASRHMSWLHCFWGVGAAISPYIMSFCLTGSLGYSGGYRIVSIIQIVLTAALFVTLPLWGKAKRKREKAAAEASAAAVDTIEPEPDSESAPETKPEKAAPVTLLKTLKIKGLPFVMLLFFAYCAAEATVMLWASSYLVNFRGLGEEMAAMFASLFFLGITAGRFLCGFIAEKVGDKSLIRIGIAVIILGAVLIGIPDKYNICTLAGFIVFGLGCAPVYPSIIHATPDNFGKNNSQSVIGVQMASAYVGSTFMPPLFGIVAQYVNIGLLPVFLLLLCAVMVVMSEMLNRSVAKRMLARGRGA